MTRVLTLTALFVVLYAMAAIVSTLSQLANGADRLLAGSGQYVFLVLLGVFGALAATPLFLYLRLPKYFAPPESPQGPEYVKYQAWLLAQLRTNQHLAGMPLQSEEDIPAALEFLSGKADVAIKSSANAIFVSTAVMQNGKLDGLIMLATQARLVWQVATIFSLRPSPRQLVYLYSNVGTAMLIAGNIDDVDFAELVSPIMASVAPSAVGAVPGLQGIASLLTNSLASGAANAFLTLRVGMLAKAYCSPLVKPEAKSIRKGATSQALALVGSIVKVNGSKVMKAVWNGVSNPLIGAAEAVGASVKSASTKAAAIAGTAANSVGTAFSATAEHVKGGASVVSDAASEVGQSLGRAAGVSAGHIKGGAAAVVDATGGAAKVLGRTASAGLGHVKDGMSSVANASKDVGGSISQATSVASSKAAELGKLIGRAADATAEGAKNAASKATGSAASVFNRNN